MILIFFIRIISKNDPTLTRIKNVEKLACSKKQLFNLACDPSQSLVSITLLLLQVFHGSAAAAATPPPHRQRRSFGWSSWSPFGGGGDATAIDDNRLLDAASTPRPITTTITASTAAPIAVDDSDLPAELLNLARSFGVRNFGRLPRLAEAQALLGTDSAADTVLAVREIAASEEGTELIRQFLASGDYVDDMVETAPADAIPTQTTTTTTTTQATAAAPSVGWFGSFASLFYGQTTTPAAPAAPVAAPAAPVPVLLRPLVAVPAVLVQQQQQQQQQLKQQVPQPQAGHRPPSSPTAIVLVQHPVAVAGAPVPVVRSVVSS